MNIRKRLNLPSKQQKKLLSADEKSILSKCDVIARNERKDLEETRQRHDGICPNCKVKKSDNNNNIVNKISQVRGSGSVVGNLFHTSGSMLIDTHVVNHCNACGNEWEKSREKSISETNILRVCLDYLAQLLDNPVYYKQFKWKLEAIGVFETAYAETIFMLSQKEDSYLMTSTKSQLSLSNLRRYYISVYDNGNKKELEKI